MRLREAVDNHPLLSKYMHCLTTADLIPAGYRPAGFDQPLLAGMSNMMKAWGTDEFCSTRPGSPSSSAPPASRATRSSAPS